MRFHRYLAVLAACAISGAVLAQAYPEKNVQYIIPFVPGGKIYDIADIAKDAHYAARAMLGEHRLKDGKSLKLPGIVPVMSETPGATNWVGPALGEHTAEVLSGLGYSEAQQQDLKRRGVI